MVYKHYKLFLVLIIKGSILRNRLLLKRDLVVFFF